MNLPIQLLKEILKSKKKISWLKFATDFNIPARFGGGSFLFGEELDLKKIEEIEKTKVHHLDVILTRQLLRELNQLDGVKYRSPVNVLSQKDLIEELKYIDFTNNYSSQDRKLISCMEIYKNKELILGFGDSFNLEKWNSIKSFIDPDELIAYRFSEFKIVILVDLRPIGDDFKKRFKVNSNLIYSLTNGLGSIDALNNLSRLSVREDIFIVDDPQKLESVYAKKDVRLIVIGDATQGKYREALINIKKFDRYARFMLVNEKHIRDEGHLLFEVEMNYARDNWAK